MEITAPLLVSTTARSTIHALQTAARNPARSTAAIVAIAALSSCATLPTKPVDYSGDEGRAAIGRVVDYHFGEIRQCYRARLAQKADFAARIVFTFKVATNGFPRDVEVKSAEGCATDDPLALCLKNEIESWKFPEASTSETAHVTYPFTFRRNSSVF